MKLAIVAAAALILTWAAPAGAVVPQGNLVRNGDAEAGAAGDCKSTQVSQSDWDTINDSGTLSGPLHYCAYGTSGGYPAPTVTGGANFFTFGYGTGNKARQPVDVSQAAPEIDAGRVRAALSAELGGYAEQGDPAIMHYDFLDATGNTTGNEVTFNVTREERANETKFIPKRQVVAVPPRTRQILVAIDGGAGKNGDTHDGYFDNVSVVLELAPATPPPTGPTGPPPPAFGPNGVITGLPSTRRCVSRRAFRIRVRQRRGRRYSIVQVFVNGRRVAVRRGRRVTAPIDLRGLPKGSYKVRIVILTTNGEVIGGTRRYRTCTKKRPGSRPGPL